MLYSNKNTIPLTLAQVRPFNHPIRRLVYLVKLIKDGSIENLFKLLKLKWDHLSILPTDKKKWKNLFQELLDTIPNFSDYYWSHHYL